MLGLGILSCYCLGSLLYWRYVASIPAPLYLLLLSGLSAVPESPLWLLGHRGAKAAGQSLGWLRCSADVGEELESLRQTMENQDRGLTMKEALGNLSRSDVRTPFLLIILNFGFVNFSGPPIMVFYAVEILQSDSVNKGKHHPMYQLTSLFYLGSLVTFKPTRTSQHRVKFSPVCCRHHSGLYTCGGRGSGNLPHPEVSEGEAEHGDDDHHVPLHAGTGLS